MSNEIDRKAAYRWVSDAIQQRAVLDPPLPMDAPVAHEVSRIWRALEAAAAVPPIAPAPAVVPETEAEAKG